jgi:uncharacterized damage-inducible protein DinB
MRLEDIELMYNYNTWANQRILAAAHRVTPEQFVAPTSHTYGSLRGTLVHLLDTEYGWRMLCRHGTVTSDLNEADFPTVAALAQAWQAEDQAMRAYLANLSDNDLVGQIHYTTDEGVHRSRVLWHVLWHVVNHGMQHRSEAAAMLTEYGQSPGDLDVPVFLNERR